MLNHDKLRELEPIFYPRSVAVVGATADDTKMGKRYLEALLVTKFPGQVYAVNPRGGVIQGIKAYPNLRAIPGPVDFVEVSIPKEHMLELMDDCAAKGVKAVQFYTAGFKELGGQENRRLEEEMVRRARAGGFRIIGPNCVGVYSAPGRLPYGMMPFMAEPGPVSIISQSGGNGGRIMMNGQARGLAFSRVISYGNASDLNELDFLEYLGVDPATKIIGSYLEGVSQGRRFLDLVGEVSRSKPVILWKGGQTPAGAETIASHTASLVGKEDLWQAALKQVGAIKAANMEELLDTIVACHHLSPFTGHRLGIIAGLTLGGGGQSVAAADACLPLGGEVPAFTEETQRRLRQVLPPVGIIWRNPVDTGGMAGENPPALAGILDLAAADPGMDLVMVILDMMHFKTSSPALSQALLEVLSAFRRSQAKPLVLVSPFGPDEEVRGRVERELARAGVPVFASVERATKALMNLSFYWRFREGG